MAENNFTSVVESLLKNADSVIGTKTVVGEPVVVGDATIIPLVDISFGVGAGANVNDKKNGAAGGMHSKMTPSAVLVIQKGHAKLVSVKNNDTLSKIVDMVPEIIDKIKEKKDGVVSSQEAVDTAFPSEE